MVPGSGSGLLGSRLRSSRFRSGGLSSRRLLRSRALVLLGRLADLLGRYLLRRRLGGRVSRRSGRGRRGGCGRSSGRGGGGVAESRYREGQGNTEAEGGEKGLFHDLLPFL